MVSERRTEDGGTVIGNQAAGGYVSYDPGTGRYSLPPEQAMALADETSGA